MEDLAESFIAFRKRYHHFFQLKTKSVSQQSLHYLCGLMQADNKNMERMVEVFPDSDWQPLQNFLSYLSWDGQALPDQIALDVNYPISGDADSWLIVDESGLSKKGNKSVSLSGMEWSLR